MIPKFEVIKKVADEKVVAVIRGQDPDEAIAISQAAVTGGLHVLELTYTIPAISKVFEALANEDVVLGAGTVLDVETARHALLYGAKFIVSPHFDEGISRLCNRYAVPYFPGCFTIAEMVRALESGCDVVKIFPANHLQPSFIKAVNGPLPQIRMIPTGGINLRNLEAWLKAGAVAVGISSELTSAYRQGGSAGVQNVCRQYRAIIHQKARGDSS